MLDPRYDCMTTEEAVKAAGYDQLGPNDCLIVFCACGRPEEVQSQASRASGPGGARCRTQNVGWNVVRLI
jgi:hypothetical protein